MNALWYIDIFLKHYTNYVKSLWNATIYMYFNSIYKFWSHAIEFTYTTCISQRNFFINIVVAV